MKPSGVLRVGLVLLVALAAASASADRTRLVCDSTTVPKYVEAQKPKVRSSCYDPLKDPALPANAKVTVHFKFDAKGEVTSVAVVQTDAPGVAACVAGRVRGWTPPCGPGELDVPFEFTR